MVDDFDWYGNNPDIVVTTQMAVAVFENERGEICVRQQSEPWQDNDLWVTFSKDRAVIIARAVLKVAGLDLSSLATTAPQRDSTAAERQRRHRDKRRDETRDTKRDGSAPLPPTGQGELLEQEA
jgi:hypothetical protein